jgi:hypothetical protein
MKKNGSTLLEMMVVVTIMLIVSAAVFSLHSVLDSTWNTDLGMTELQKNVRLGVDGMTREIRQSKPSQLAIPNSQRIDFSIPNHPGTISYYLEDNKIIREYPAGTTKTIAEDITYFNLCCQGGTGCSDCTGAKTVKISLRASKTFRGRALSFPVNPADTLIEEVLMRNK